MGTAATGSTQAPRPGVTGKSLWHRIRRIWATFGLVAMVVFAGWMYFGYRASSVAVAAMRGDANVSVQAEDSLIYFSPAAMTKKQPVGLLFFAGAVVDPRAYAPLAHEIAMAGYPVTIIPLPRRGMFGGADEPVLMEIAADALNTDERVSQWIIGGHSKGAVVAIKFEELLRSMGASTVAGLLLVGTTHPRDVDLSKLKLPVTKIVGTKDGVAPIAKVEANSRLLPPQTRWVRIEGGNHSQFGFYGFQPGDHFASISRDAQFTQLVAAVKESLRSAAEMHSPTAPP